jgi:hypothetical protein
MTTVADILTAAYLRSSQNDPGKLALDPELIGHLNRIYQRTWMLLARARVDEFTGVRALTFTGVPPSVALPASLSDIVRILDADTNETVNVVPITDLLRKWNIAPRVHRTGMTLYSGNRAGDPIAGDVVNLVYLDAPSALTALADVLDPRWPARHEQLLVDYLAVYLSVKDAGRDARDRQALLQELQQDVAALVSEYQLAPSAMGWIHADAERATG